MVRDVNVNISFHTESYVALLLYLLSCFLKSIGQNYEVCSNIDCNGVLYWHNESL